ncbi:MAG: pyridoxamine 5'-phosphate oxidase family protein, partial [Acidobacteriota bacterium]
RLREMVKEIDFCMLTTLDEEGALHSRPMSVNGEIDPDGDLWFFTYGSSHKVAEIEKAPGVNVSFANPEKHRYVSITGGAELVRDKAKVEELWKPQFKIWFPKGTDEPDIALLRINVEKAEYWDSPSSSIAQAFYFVSALVTGTKMKGGENKKLELA